MRVKSAAVSRRRRFATGAFTDFVFPSAARAMGGGRSGRSRVLCAGVYGNGTCRRRREIARGGSGRDGGERRRRGPDGSRGCGPRRGWEVRGDVVPAVERAVSCKSYISRSATAGQAKKEKVLPVLEGWTADTVAAYMGPPRWPCGYLQRGADHDEDEEPEHDGTDREAADFSLALISTRPRLWMFLWNLAEEAAKTRRQPARGGKR